MVRYSSGVHKSFFNWELNKDEPDVGARAGDGRALLPSRLNLLNCFNIFNRRERGCGSKNCSSRNRNQETTRKPSILEPKVKVDNPPSDGRCHMSQVFTCFLKCVFTTYLSVSVRSKWRFTGPVFNSLYWVVCGSWLQGAGKFTGARCGLYAASALIPPPVRSQSSCHFQQASSPS